MYKKNKKTGNLTYLQDVGGYVLVAPVFSDVITLHPEFTVDSSGIRKDLGVDYDKMVICIECSDETVRIDFSDTDSGVPSAGSGKRINAGDEACFAPPQQFIRLITDSGTAKITILDVGAGS